MSELKDLASQSVAAWHIPDQVRVGVLAGIEEHERWLQAHLLSCDECRVPLIDLLGKLAKAETTAPELGQVTCSEARNAIFHFLETGREPALNLLDHIVSCELCVEPFYEPAKARVVLEHYPDDTGEAG